MRRIFWKVLSLMICMLAVACSDSDDETIVAPELHPEFTEAEMDEAYKQKAERKKEVDIAGWPAIVYDEELTMVDFESRNDKTPPASGEEFFSMLNYDSDYQFRKSAASRDDWAIPFKTHGQRGRMEVYNPLYKGVYVAGSCTLWYDKSGKMLRMEGSCQPVKDFNVTPALTPDKAKEKMAMYLGAKVDDLDSQINDECYIAFYPKGGHWRPRLCYSGRSMKRADVSHIVIDANTGSLIFVAYFHEWCGTPSVSH